MMMQGDDHGNNGDPLGQLFNFQGIDFLVVH